jgi:hypothetical protein
LVSTSDIHFVSDSLSSLNFSSLSLLYCSPITAYGLFACVHVHVRV